MKVIQDSWLSYRRALIERLRVPAWVTVSLAQPLVYLFLFGPLLSKTGVASHYPGGAYNLFVPGLLVLMAYFVAGGAGFGLIEEITSGVIERLQVTPLSRVSLVLGRAGRDVTALAVQSVILLAIGRLAGMHPNWTGAALATAVVCLLGLAISCLSNALALKTRDNNGFAALFNGLSIPVLLLSGVLLPLSLAPAWLGYLADLNPLRYGVDATRALIDGQLTSAIALRGLAVSAGFALVSLAVSVHYFRRTVT
jgi:ABC-2 type transport system permease protein